MSHQPVQNRLVFLSLFTLSVGGTFALFGGMPWIAQSLTAHFIPKPIDRVEAPLHNTEATPSHPSKLAGTSKRIRPMLSRRKPSDTSSRSTL